jgi:hypothetical protein
MIKVPTVALRPTRRPNDARDLLAPVYGCFTEGFDTLDLKQAKAFSATANSCRPRIHPDTCRPRSSLLVRQLQLTVYKGETVWGDRVAFFASRPRPLTSDTHRGSRRARPAAMGQKAPSQPTSFLSFGPLASRPTSANRRSLRQAAFKVGSLGHNTTGGSQQSWCI